MYRYSNGQISLADFKQPVDMNLKESNRWVKKAQTIPWLEIEKRYAALFTNRKGNVAKPLRLALGACIIQAEYGYSDEETALQIQETPYLQYFCGYPGYDDEKLPLIMGKAMKQQYEIFMVMCLLDNVSTRLL